MTYRIHYYSFLIIFFIFLPFMLFAQTNNLPEQGIFREITMDSVGDYIGVPHNTIVTESGSLLSPGLEQGAGRTFENGVYTIDTVVVLNSSGTPDYLDETVN